MLTSFARTVARSAAAVPCRGLFSSVTAVPADPILGLVAAFKTDSAIRKVNLAQGAYRTEEGQPFVLGAVREAEEMVVAAGHDKEYLGVEGNTEFLEAASAFAFGSGSEVLDGRIAAVQSLSGTGALRLAADTLKLIGGVKKIYLSSPSWGNHQKIFAAAGLEVGNYRYLDYDSGGTAIDFAGMVEDIQELPDGSTVLLHACAHNPTGVDPTAEQWQALAPIFKQKNLFPLFDSAYQGYASGDPTKDAYSIRHFQEEGMPHGMMVCQSFAKSMGLYGERVGAFNVVTDSKSTAEALMTRIKAQVVRPNYSSPPLHGARLAALVLTDASLKAKWMVDLQMMSTRINAMRLQLVAELQRLETPCPSGKQWSHITDQIGMFAFTGLTSVEVNYLREVHSIYLTADGRMSLAGLSGKDVGYVAAGIDAARRQ